MSGFVSPAGEGKEHDALGMSIRLKAVSQDTSGVLEAMEGVFPPGLPFPAHTHRNSDEAFYILEGTMAVRVGERTSEESAGSFGFFPKGVVHGFENKGTSPARLMVIQMPAPGIERMIDELAALPPGPPNMGKVLPIMQRYDVVPEPPGS